MPSIKFSIIISTIGADSLPQVLNLFLDHYDNLEIILVLDKPGLSVEALLTPDLLKDSRLKVILNATNLGPTKSFNKAIALARGEIMVRADDDDIPTPDRLKELDAFFNAHPDVDLAFSFAQGLDVKTGRSWIIDGPTNDAAIRAKLLVRNFIVHSYLAFRRARLAEIGFYDETFRYAQDYDLYLRSIRSNFRFGCVSKVLVTRYYHGDSITVSKRKRQILNSMSARLLHIAWSEKYESPWPVIFRYVYLLAIPNWVRSLRRKLGLGK
jgi:GT2 family glycosyltransferase